MYTRIQSVFSILILWLFCLVYKAKAQIYLPDVPRAFNAISTSPQTIHLKRNNIKIPSGGHFQGIQALSDSEFVITASSSSYAYYITTDHKVITSMQKLSDSPFRHAGGCQLWGKTLFVGVEDNATKDKSEILVAGHFYPNNGKFAYPIIFRNGTFKRSTAGAVGVAWTLNGILMAVADWDSKNIDFYLCQNGNPRNFDSLTTYHAPVKSHRLSYQTINLVNEVGGKIYLIGMGLDGVNNRADLYEVVINAHRIDLHLINTRIFKCTAHAGFRYASGIGISADNRLIIYSYGMKPKSSINIFQ